MLVVEGLSVHVGRRAIVEQVSFTAHAGEVTAVIGPNGAGKTSLIEAITGVRPASAGSVRIAGGTLASFADCARAFAYLPDQGELAAEVSVRTLVAHALGNATGLVDSEQLRRLLSVESLLDMGAGVLSRGERQRLLLFTTLVLGRPIVVLDEPFSTFDPLQLRDVHRAIRTVAASGAAVLASIHQLADAEKIADRVLLLADGRSIASGTLASLKAEAGDPDLSLEDIFVTLLGRSSRVA
jgi:ABC-2 type transport system ATP-binding protein